MSNLATTSHEAHWVETFCHCSLATWNSLPFCAFCLPSVNINNQLKWLPLTYDFLTCFDKNLIIISIIFITNDPFPFPKKAGGPGIKQGIILGNAHSHIHSWCYRTDLEKESEVWQIFVVMDKGQSHRYILWVCCVQRQWPGYRRPTLFILRFWVFWWWHFTFGIHLNLHQATTPLSSGQS